MEASALIDGQAQEGVNGGAVKHDAHAKQRPQLRGYMGLIVLYNGAVALARNGSPAAAKR